MKPAIVYHRPAEVRKRLAELGLALEPLLQVVEGSVAGYSACTANDPPMAQGWEAWRWGTRRAREIFVPTGWERDDTGNLSSIVNHALRLRIVVVNTDDGTGRLDAEPSNRSKKGGRSEQAANHNLQLRLALEPPEIERAIQEQMKADALSDYETWYLCQHIMLDIKRGDISRAELSFPTTVSCGYLGGWKERIILRDDDGPVGSKARERDDGFTPEFEINVRRRA
ncbi:MAG TPA: hypothetical protein VG843_01330 [Rhizomicrobium sp.]|jgi:hypothetical protein|nr:hypothetical protein [Rhizomicrobium sp.]